MAGRVLDCGGNTPAKASPTMNHFPQADDRLLRRGLLLEYITLVWNVVGTAVVIAAAIPAISVALAGFGLVLIGAGAVISIPRRGAKLRAPSPPAARGLVSQGTN